MKITYYLEVISSWCYWAEPAWAELKGRYAGQVEFGWKIALMPPEAYPVSKSQCEWFYRRSGSIVRSPFMLNSGWFENEFRPCMAPNYVVEAARDFGVNDDRVRLAIAHAALREGRKLGRWDEAVSVGAKAAGVDPGQLQKRAQSPEVAARAAATTAEFHALQINQRPAFLLENAIGDRVVFSGLVKPVPLAASLDAMLADEAAYASWKAHFGDVPTD
jgi:predicted DsbA family dithiol-disulfide isomerase